VNKRAPQIKTQAFLANLPMFSEMSREELDRVAAATLPVYVAKGESVFQCGDPCAGFHIVVYGQVKLGFTSPQGIEKGYEHTVESGQSLSLIIQAYREKGVKVTQKQVLDANPGLNLNRLQPGQKIFIPDSAK